MVYVSFREFIPQMVKNGDESHGIRIRKKAPTKQTQASTPMPSSKALAMAHILTLPNGSGSFKKSKVDANESQLDKQNLCISLSHVICVFVNFEEL